MSIRLVDCQPCARMIRRLDEYVDRRLTPRERLAIEAHLDRCPGCSKRFHFEAALLGLIRERLRRIEIPHDLPDKVTRRLAVEG